MRIDEVSAEASASAFGDDALGAVDGVEIARRIRTREVHPTETVEAAIARAERVNPLLNAIAAPLYESARRKARDEPVGELGGVPSFIKDTEEVVGSPMRFGSRGMPRRLAVKSSVCAEQFLSAGLIALGKTTTSEFGLTGTTEALLYGRTHNPWRLGFSAGGSSGGSAALVAAGVVPLAHGNDGGGSIRIPASCCGLVGLKPSRGRLADMDHAELFPVRIVHQGMLSRTVRDTAAYYHAIEQRYRNPKLPDIGLICRPGRRLRIGFSTEIGEGAHAHPECVAATHEAARLCESLGHHVEETFPPFDDAFHQDFFLLWSMLAFGITRLGRHLVDPEFDSSQVEAFTEGLSRFFKSNAFSAPAAIWRLRRFARRYERRFESYDVLMNPTVAMPPPEHGFIGPEVPFDTALERFKWFVPFTPVQNTSGGPAISLPLGQSKDGLPIGVQFAAPMGGERTLLELALELEGASPWPSLADV